MRYIIIILLSTIAFAEDKPAPQPIEVQRVMSEYERSIYQAHKAYDAAALKASDAAITALDRTKKDYMVKGDLEGANLVQAAIKKIKDGDAFVATETKIREASVANLFKLTPLEQALVASKWMRMTNDYIITFNADKTADAAGPMTSKGAWSVEKGKVILTWERVGWGKDIIFYIEKTDSIKCENGNWTATRIK